MVKVLFVADTFLPKKDGVVTFMLETYARLKNEFEISFLVPKFEGSEKAAKALGINTIFVPVRRFEINDYKLANPKSKIVKKAIDDADIIFINSIALLGSKAMNYARSKKKKIIEYVHSFDWELLSYATKFPDKYTRVLKAIVKRLYNKADLLIVADTFISDKLRTLDLVRPGFTVIPLGVNVDKFREDTAERFFIRKKLGIQGNFVIGYHGRLSKEKNIEKIIRIFKATKRVLPETKLLLVGDGNERNNIPESKDIIVTGFVDNPEDYLRAMDVYLLASKTETSALSLMEAMATKLPVIATPLGAIPSYITTEQNGFLVSTEAMNPGIVSRLILKLYKQPILRKKIGENARETIFCFRTWNDTARELSKVFHTFSRK